MFSGDIPTYPVVFAAADGKYFMEHASSFIFSATENGFDVHIHIIHPTAEVWKHATYLQALSKGKVTYTWHSVKDGVDPETLRVHYATARFVIAPHILDLCGKLLILDIDCMIMKPFEFPKEPVAFFPRTDEVNAANEWEKQGMKVAAGAVYFDKRGIEVCFAVTKELGELEQRWFVDQVALSRVMDRVPEDAIHHFDSEFMDWEFKEGTAIWTGKGPRKYENENYLSAKKDWDLFDEKLKDYNNIILKPRLDVPFKQSSWVKPTFDMFDVDLPEIRTHWKNFVDIKQKELNALVLHAPKYWFDPSYTEVKEDATYYVPHMERAWWGGGDNCKYYMQTVFPWLFTIDDQGWAGGSAYKETFDVNAEYDTKLFDSLKKYIKQGKTKFEDIQGESNWEFDDRYILVPLQIPHDETLKYHSDVSMKEMVTAMCEWADSDANTDKVTVVFKGHPINYASMYRLEEVIEQYDNVIYTTQSHIKPMMENAEAVFVVNSGTGQEAMLHEKPVVTFGRCDYKEATIHGDVTDISGTWEKVNSDDHEKRVALYKKWFGWFDTVTFNTKNQ